MSYDKLYLTYLNDFITVRGFANWLGVHPKKASKILLKGKVIHQDKFGHH